MARFRRQGPSARVVLNRQRTAKVHLAVADGLGAVGLAILRRADPPDATPYGAGLVRNGGLLLYRGRSKLAGFGLDGRQPRKPRAVRLEEDQTVCIVGYGFPGRFQELGTVRQAAQPFLTPAAQAVLPTATATMAAVVSTSLRRIA